MLYKVKLDSKIDTHSQAHLQFAQANAQAKNCKRACLFTTAFLPTRKNKIRIVLNWKYNDRNEESPAGNNVYKALGDRWLY